MADPTHFVSASCQGETCRFVTARDKVESFAASIFDTSGVVLGECGHPARHKVYEEIFHDDPNQVRHPLGAYLCCFHYSRVMGQVCHG